jgi:hypothetical protein
MFSHGSTLEVHITKKIRITDNTRHEKGSRYATCPGGHSAGGDRAGTTLTRPRLRVDGAAG